MYSIYCDIIWFFEASQITNASTIVLLVLSMGVTEISRMDPIFGIQTEN